MRSARPPLRGVGVRPRPGEQQRTHALGDALCERERAVPTHRRTRDGKLAVDLAGDRLGPRVHRAPAPVQMWRDHLVVTERSALRLPHLLVEWKRMQEEDLHSVATTSSSAAIAGRSESRSSQPARAP